MSERVPFSAVKPGDRIEFDSGYHMTGTFVRGVGTHRGKRMARFLRDGDERDMIVSYAEHRSVIRHEA